MNEVRASDERRHAPGPDPRWSESWSFDFFDSDASIGGWVRLGLHPNLGVAWYHGLLVRPRRPPISVSDLEVALPKGDSREIRAPGLWADHLCETPLEHWTVVNEAHGVAVEHPADLYAAEPRGDLVPLAIDLEWETHGHAYPDVPGSGYEVPCVVHGEILVGDERVELEGWGQRRHAWGRSDSWSTASTSVSGWLDDGSRFYGRVVGDAGCGHGWVQVGGHRAPAAEVRTSTDLGAAGLPASAAIAIGDISLAVAPLAFAPARFEWHGDESRVARALCRFTAADGRAGVGWAEWNQPVHG